MDIIKDRPVLSFIQNEIKNKNSIDEILKPFNETEEFGEIEGQQIQYSKRGFVYERLWDICVKFGVVDNLTLKPIAKEIQTSHVFGNVNNQTSVSFDATIWNTNFKSFMEEPIQSGNSGGYSDITFINKNQDSHDANETLNLISVKYFEHDEKKGPDKYDIGKLCTLIETHSKENREIKILLFVKDKKTVTTKFKRANKSSNIMLKYINPGGNYENIYDKTDLEQHFYKLKQLLELYNYLESPQNETDFQEYLGILKQPFIPRFHQELFINKIDELLKPDKQIKNILVGAIPRSGKTYIMAGSILRYVNEHPGKKSNFVIITPAPTETFPEYLALFKNYIDFHDSKIWNIIDTKDGSSKINVDMKRNNIIIVSKQKLGWGKESDDTKIMEGDSDFTVKKNIIEFFPKGSNIKLDLIFLDEAHFGMSTPKAGTILTQIDTLCGSTPKIFVTATYKKPLETYGIDQTPEAKITWDLNDINIMKKLKSKDESNEIKTRFGKKLYEDVINVKYSLQQITDSYKVYPQPYLITSIWDYEYIVDEQKKIGDTQYGFDMDKLFTVAKKDGKYTSQFENQDGVSNIIRYYFGEPDRQNDYRIQHMTKHRGIIPRINKICQNKCRTMQINNKPTSQLWFMPYGQQRPIKNVIDAFLTLIDNRFPSISKDYYFYVALPDKSATYTNVKVQYMDGTPIKQHIESIEKGLTEGKIGGNSITQSNLIILAGARLQLGISLKNVDIVTLWNNITSSDAIYQMLFRSMTEVDTTECEADTYCNKKKFGFMVDLNPQRALTNMFLFKENMYDHKPSDSEYEPIGDLIHVDEDVMLDRYGAKGGKEEFIKDMFDKLYDSWGNNSDSMKRLTRKTITYDVGILENIKNVLQDITLASKPSGKTNGTPPGFNSGNKVVKTKSGDKKTKKVTTKEISLEEKASEIMYEYLSLLNIFNLYNEDTSTKCFISGDTQDLKGLEFERNKQHTKIFSDTPNKAIFLKILNGRLGNNDNDEFREEVLNKLISSIQSDSNKISVNKLMKTQKNKYYSYTINEPAKLLEYINDNLTPKDKERKEKGEVFTPMWLVNEMLDKLPEEVWSNWEYKWLDPAVGIGNFPIAIYLKLMEGLKGTEPNEEKRRKHILEKMLFMVDISDKNIYILNKIFCGHKYKLNIHKGSFFKQYEAKDKEGNKIIKDDYSIPGNWTDTFSESTFDVILGNPPYNKQGTNKGGAPIWKYFIELSFEKLNLNGYLNFVHPGGWRKPIGKTKTVGDIFDKFKKEGHIIHLNISTKPPPHFPKVDYYVFKKIKQLTSGNPTTTSDSVSLYDYETTVDNIFNSYEHKDLKLKLGNLHFIPNLVSKQSISILLHIIKKGNNFNFEYDPTVRPNSSFDKTTGIPHAYFYNNKSVPYKYIEIFLSKEEILELYSSKKEKVTKIPDFYSKPKIILTLKSGPKKAFLYPEYFSKQIGGTNNTMYKIIKPEDKNKYLNFFESNMILFLMKITQYSESPNHMNEQKIINLIDKSKFDTLSNNPDDPEIYAKYGISPNEIKYIEEIILETPNNAAAKPKQSFSLKVKKANNNAPVKSSTKKSVSPESVHNTKSSTKSVSPKMVRPRPGSNEAQQIKIALAATNFNHASVKSSTKKSVSPESVRNTKSPEAKPKQHKLPVKCSKTRNPEPPCKEGSEPAPYKHSKKLCCFKVKSSSKTKKISIYKKNVKKDMNHIYTN